MVRRYTVVITVERDSLESFARGDVPVIAKPPGTAAPSVIWVSALAGQTRLTWDENDYGLFAAHAPPYPGNPIEPDVEAFPAEPRQLYGFDGAGIRRLEASTTAPGRYEFTNFGPSAVTVGLIQRPSVNGRIVRAPLNGIVLPAGLTAEFARSTRIYVWLAPTAAPGTVISRVPENATIVALEANRQCTSIHYEPATSSFVDR